MREFLSRLDEFRRKIVFWPKHPPTRWLLLSVVVIIADQVTKFLVLTHLRPYERIELLPVLNVTLLFNRGAAFSFLAGATGWQQWLFVGLAIAFSIAIVVWLHRLPARGRAWLAVGLALVLAGALGNAIDRIWHSHVIDFIQVHYSNAWYFPTFNVADSSITIGAIIAIADALFHGRPQENPQSDSRS